MSSLGGRVDRLEDLAHVHRAGRMAREIGCTVKDLLAEEQRVAGLLFELGERGTLEFLAAECGTTPEQLEARALELATL